MSDSECAGIGICLSSQCVGRPEAHLSSFKLHCKAATVPYKERQSFITRGVKVAQLAYTDFEENSEVLHESLYSSRSADVYFTAWWGHEALQSVATTHIAE